MEEIHCDECFEQINGKQYYETDTIGCVLCETCWLWEFDGPIETETEIEMTDMSEALEEIIS